MITVVLKLGGGLGNQLFQYAVGRRIADDLGEDFEIDARWYVHNKTENVNKQLWLDKLPIRGTLKKYSRRGPLGPHGLLTRTKRKITEALFITRFTEENFFFDELVLSISKNTVIEGFLQSARYLVPFDEKLRSELSAASILNEIEINISRCIENEKYISIHVRRGDYLQIAGFPLRVPSKYFMDAMALMRQKVVSPKFIVFSDDLSWCRTFPVFRECAFFDHPKISPLIEMYIMSRCAHHIISNSTFSWWAAWLGDYRGQINIVPAEWIHGVCSREGGLIPDHWLSV